MVKTVKKALREIKVLLVHKVLRVKPEKEVKEVKLSSMKTLLKNN
jgi:hypothetical protein